MLHARTLLWKTYWEIKLFRPSGCVLCAYGVMAALAGVALALAWIAAQPYLLPA
jgi:hypothetical protein